MMHSHGPTEVPHAPSRRLLPQRAFPAYTYVPGSDAPHPVGDPRGHSYGRHEPACAPPDAGNWRSCERFLWGVDLFNTGYYWEAHEAWESAWIAAGRTGATADFLKALIKLAAAGVKLREQNSAGAQRHLRRAAELLKAFDPGSQPFGVSVAALRRDVERLRSGHLPDQHPRNSRPDPVLGLMLRPI